MARKNNYDIELFHNYKIYIPTRTLYMGSEGFDPDGSESGTDFSMAERLIKNLTVLEHLSKDPITIIMNNIGGDVNAGLAIYDAIQACESHITIKVLGNATSMGSIVLQAADHRIMSPNSEQMVHYGTLGAEGNTKDVYKLTERIKQVDQWMESMYLARIREKNPKYSLTKLQKLLTNDTYLTAAQSVELGLCDEIT